MRLNSSPSKLLSWFAKHQRDLPWRGIKDPYAIWISEVLLQQTQVQTAIPYYRRFLKHFPNLSSLAKAKREDIFHLWAGLGYYKRAESLALSAKELSRRKGGFPKSYKELLNFSGFGPYTARAVSSLAFEEPVGVLDGNVIRFLSRFHGLSVKWWKAEARTQLQDLSDLWVKKRGKNQPSLMNQALMEIGSLICKKSSPLCLICPVFRDCQAQKQGLVKSLPLKRAKSPSEFWYWNLKLIKKNSRWAFVKNKSLPFLKGRFVFPGEAYRDVSKGVNNKGKVATNREVIGEANKRAGQSLPASLDSVAHNRGLAHRGGAHRGLAHRKGAHRGRAYRGVAHRGGTYRGEAHGELAHRKGAHRGLAHGELAHGGGAHKLSAIMSHRQFHFQHSITKYRIFVNIQKVDKVPSCDVKWFTEREVRAHNPSSLIKKVFEISRIKQ